jgi:uncharacterized phiE125 gp8 family phage protein
MGDKKMYALRISSASTIEPVAVTDVKTHLRIASTAQGGSSSEDTLLQGYITAARQQAENQTKRALIPTSFEILYDGFYSSVIELPRAAPLSTSTAADLVITYRKTTGDTTTLDSTYYTVESRTEPASIRLNYGSQWPTNVQTSEGALSIAYKSGYTTATCPESVKTWIKIRVGELYNHREPLITGTIVADVPRTYVDGLLDPYRLIKL